MDLLTDLQVVDCSSGISGGYCAKLLSGAGAEVIKVESPDGDPLRRWTNQGYWDGAPGDVGGTDGALFQFLHFGHRSIVATDLEDIADLLAGADLLVTDGRGIVPDPAALHERFPQLVVVSITPYGLEGPYADRPATELTLQAESGALSIARTPRPTAGADGRPHHGVGQRSLRRGRGARRAAGSCATAARASWSTSRSRRWPTPPAPPRPTSWTRCAVAPTRAHRRAASRRRRSSRPPTATWASTPTPARSSTASCC